jgi:isocitrate dehydrogenase
MGAWSADSKNKVEAMKMVIFYGSEKSITIQTTDVKLNS